MAESLLEQLPKVQPALDPEFRPAALGNRAFRAAATAGGGTRLVLALERSAGNVSLFETSIFPEQHPEAASNLRYVERVLKFLLWAKGALSASASRARASSPSTWRGPYAPSGARAFDAEFLAKIYEQPSFVVRAVPFAELPKQREQGAAIGGHLDGCRIGFDAGGSDRKVAAVIDGKEVFSCEVAWEPKLHADPQYHFDGIDDSIRRAAAALATHRRDRRELRRDLFEQPHDGRVALPAGCRKRRSKRGSRASTRTSPRSGGVCRSKSPTTGTSPRSRGALELADHSVLGIALGTSVAAGYVNSKGLVSGWLNELAFAPVDYGAHAALDHEWSGGPRDRRELSFTRRGDALGAARGARAAARLARARS